MNEATLEDDLDELSSAEDFLQYFAIEYDPRVVHVNRLHILQRFHDYLNQAADAIPEQEAPKRAVYARLLEQAYVDFVESDARTEKVFKVFRMHEPQQAFIPLEQLLK